MFSNWPDFKTVLKSVHGLAWSSDSQLLALGNEEGSLNIYKLPHY